MHVTFIAGLYRLASSEDLEARCRLGPCHVLKKSTQSPTAIRFPSIANPPLHLTHMLTSLWDWKFVVVVQPSPRFHRLSAVALTVAAGRHGVPASNENGAEIPTRKLSYPNDTKKATAGRWKLSTQRVIEA